MLQSSNTRTEVAFFARRVEPKWRRAKKLIYGECILRRVAEGNGPRRPRVIRRAGNRERMGTIFSRLLRRPTVTCSIRAGRCAFGDCRTGTVSECKSPKRRSDGNLCGTSAHDVMRHLRTFSLRRILNIQEIADTCTIVYLITSTFLFFFIFFTHQTCISSTNYFEYLSFVSDQARKPHLHYNSAITENWKLMKTNRRLFFILYVRCKRYYIYLVQRKFLYLFLKVNIEMWYEIYEIFGKSLLFCGIKILLLVHL